MTESDIVGDSGEDVCLLALTREWKGRRWFKPTLLGGKFAATDIFVELVEDFHLIPCFFFIQVKSTTTGYLGKHGNLNVRVSQEDMERLRVYPAPTYVVGVNERDMSAYIVSANEAPARAIRSLSTRFPLKDENLELLWHEIRRYWGQRDMSLTGSVFA